MFNDDGSEGLTIRMANQSEQQDLQPMKYADRERNPAYQLWLASNAWQREVRRALEPLDLTHVQFVILASVSILSEEFGRCVSQVQVCRFAVTDANMTSQVVRSLVEKGWLLRLPHPEDKRAHRLKLTEEGARLTAEARLIVRGCAEEFFYSRLGDKHDQLVELLRLLNGSEPLPEP
jgi:DNA-binding MarR family transcriptional regulator